MLLYMYMYDVMMKEKENSEMKLQEVRFACRKSFETTKNPLDLRCVVYIKKFHEGNHHHHHSS